MQQTVVIPDNTTGTFDNDTNTLDQETAQTNEQMNFTSKAIRELTLSEHRKEYMFEALGEQRPPPLQSVTNRKV